MAKKAIIVQGPIPDINTPWEWIDENGQLKAYDGGAIENLLRQVITDLQSTKIGYFVIPQNKETDGYYHLWGFASQSDYSDYLTDTVGNASLRLLNTAIPILEEQGGVSNIVTLTRNSAASIVTSKAVASVEVSYLWQQYNPITKETTDQDEDATIVVSCRTQNANGTWGAWDSSKEFTVSIQSGQTKTIDLSKLLTSDATYQVRLVATGETSEISASPVTVSIVYSNVAANYEGQIATAYQGSSIQLPFRISGSAQKQLRIKIGTYTKNFTLGTTTYTDNTFGATLTQAEFGLTRGAVKAEAWVAFGEGYVAETEHQEFQFIYLPENDAVTTPILAVTDIMEEFQNWTRATIFKYAIYNPQANETFLRITLQDRTTGQIYIQKDITCVNGESYDFDENFGMEYEGDEQPTTIQAQATFVNAAGLTYGNNINFTVDNSENFAPTKGANLILSPEKHSLVIDGEDYDVADLITDKDDTNSGWKTNAEVDSTGAQVNVPVLSIAAGNKLTIPYELFNSNTGHNNNGVEGSITIEFDLKVKNIVSNSPIIDASAPFDKAYTGLKFYPTRAVCLSQNNNSEDICDASFCEETREHIAINIIRNLRGEGLNLVRFYINGKSNRSYIYTDEDNFIPIGANGAQNIVIGSDDADIDIYGLRVYQNQQLGSVQIQNDYMAGMPTIEDKKKFKRFNSIYNGTEISYDQCNAMGLNTILRKIPQGGHYPSRENQDKQKNVTIDVRIFKERGNAESLDRKHSGTFVGMTDKGQGTSAKGYYWWNISDGFEDDVEIAADAYDSSNPTHYTADGKYFKKISYFNSLDGTSQVYASKYEIEDGRGGITKLVGKCNYASPMQSHKLGGVWAYDELWQLLVNDGSGDRTVLQNTHATCYELPFLCFYQIGNGNPVFCGFQTWGSGKGDKKTFGYDKKKSPGYMCVSGADNGAVAALFQMPWLVSKNTQGVWSGNIYPKSVTINTGDVKNGYCYKSGVSDNLAFEVEIGSKYDGGETDKGVLRIADEAKGETETTLYTHFADFCNFICSCSPLLKPYAGTEAQLIADSANLKRDHQYWLFNTGADRYKVYYYNPLTAKFEQLPKVATKWGADGRASQFGSPTLTAQLAGVTVTIDSVEGKTNMSLEDAMETLGTSDMNVVNDLFCKARVAYFKAHADSYLDIVDVIFHQCFCKLFGATDNRTKNTYYWIDPAIDKLVRLKQDDLDTILATDNQGRQTKPYYVLEHTKDSNGSNYWNGENNILYTLIERAYPDRMRNMMRDMFSRMSQIAGSVEEYMQKRFYWVQEYFPAVAYNETSRVLYEVAQVKLMNGLIDVSQDPITQAVGDQLECEKQFMAQRLPMLMSWCEYETGGDGTLSFRSVNNRAGNSPTYDIEYTAYQYIYPKLAIGGNMAALYAMVDGEWKVQDGEPYLCAPGETVRFVATTDSNTQLTMRWMHYAQRLGNIGSLPCGDDGDITITGRRLRKLNCSSPDGTPIEFHPKGISILNCRNLEEVNLTNASSFSGGFSFDLPRLKKLLLKGSAYTSVTLPKTSTLTQVAYPASINSIVVNGQPNLSSISVESMANVRTLSVTGRHKIQTQTQPLVQLAYSQGQNVNSVAMENIAWTGMSVNVLTWLQNLNASLTGSIGLSDNLTYAAKASLVATYGNIDSADNDLYVTYNKFNITGFNIKGDTYMSQLGLYPYSIAPVPSRGNDVAIKNGKLDIEWTIEEGGQIYATFEDAVAGLLRVSQLDASGTDTRYAITCKLTRINGQTITNSVHVGFYLRVPKIGDFAYADGTFDDQFQRDKTVVGVVYKIDPMYQGPGDESPTTYTGYNKPTESVLANKQLVGYRVLIDSKEDAVIKSTDSFINTSSNAWGLYPDGSTGVHGTNGFTTEMGNKIQAQIGSNAFDTPIANIGNTSEWSYGWYIHRGTYFNNEESDGFKQFSTGSPADWDGKNKTRQIVRHMESIFNGYLMGEFNEDILTEWIEETDNGNVVHQITDLPTNLEELGNMMEILQKANGNLGIFRQFAFPAAYSCYLYEPALKEGETLDPQFARNNWYLPAQGELMRQYSFFGVSRTGGMGTDQNTGRNTSPNRSVIDAMIQAAHDSSESNPIKQIVKQASIDASNYSAAEMTAINQYFQTLPECEMPIYSLVLWRALVGGNSSPFINHSAGYHWSSSENSSNYSWYVYFNDGNASTGNKYNNFTVRPSVAYVFML